MYDYGNFYQLIGDVILRFIERKPSPFPGSVLSREGVWMCPPWKRAMVFVFLVRNLLEMKSQKMWSKFSYEDYCVNKRSFKRYLQQDEIIMKRSTKYRRLPVVCCPGGTFAGKKKTVVSKRKTGYSSISEDSPLKRRCKLADSTTEEEEDE